MQIPSVRERAIRALIAAFDEASGGAARDDRGYVANISDNFAPGLNWKMIEPAFRDGAGQETIARRGRRPKMLAVHSSSALAVNVFGPWVDRPSEVSLLGGSGFDDLKFERRCPTGLRGTPPHLDVFLSAEESVVGIESKCLETLSEHDVRFSVAYDRLADKNTPWSRLIRELNSFPNAYRFLDVAQLVKHALGLAHTFPKKVKTLLYLYWEPVNWREFDEFRRHREEIARLADAVGGASVRFVAKSYPELWAEWGEDNLPTARHDHLEWLRRRYVVDI